MSSINQHKHNFLGFFECPISLNASQKQTEEIQIYELLEDVTDDETDFDGRTGDIIVGGGNLPAFRIAVPEAIYFFTDEDWDDFDTHEDLFQSFWSPTESAKLCEGFTKLGWTPDYPIEFWLAENVCLLLIDNVEKFIEFKGEGLAKSKLRFFR